MWKSKGEKNLYQYARSNAIVALAEAKNATTAKNKICRWKIHEFVIAIVVQ